MSLAVGSRVHSTACDTELIVVGVPTDEIDLRCGGQPIAPGVRPETGEDKKPLDPRFSAGTLLGKRYRDPASGLEVLCVKPGDGSLSIGDVLLELAQAKMLPASD
jgi:hypothetical protein